MSFLKSVLGVSENDVKDLEDCAAAFGQESIGEAYIDYNHEVQQGTLIPTLMYVVMEEAINNAIVCAEHDLEDFQWHDHYQIDSNYSMWGINSDSSTIHDLDSLKSSVNELLERLSLERAS